MKTYIFLCTIATVLSEELKCYDCDPQTNGDCSYPVENKIKSSVCTAFAKGLQTQNDEITGINLEHQTINDSSLYECFSLYLNATDGERTTGVYRGCNVKSENDYSSCDYFIKRLENVVNCTICNSTECNKDYVGFAEALTASLAVIISNLKAERNTINSNLFIILIDTAMKVILVVFLLVNLVLVFAQLTCYHCTPSFPGKCESPEMNNISQMNCSENNTTPENQIMQIIDNMNQNSTEQCYYLYFETGEPNLTGYYRGCSRTDVTSFCKDVMRQLPQDKNAKMTGCHMCSTNGCNKDNFQVGNTAQSLPSGLFVVVFGLYVCNL